MAQEAATTRIKASQYRGFWRVQAYIAVLPIAFAFPPANIVAINSTDKKMNVTIPTDTPLRSHIIGFYLPFLTDCGYRILVRVMRDLVLQTISIRSANELT